MSDDVPNLRGNPLTTLAFVLGPLLAAIITVCGIVWTAAKYPDRVEFDQQRNDTIITRQDVAILKVEQSSSEAWRGTIEVKIDRMGAILEELRVSERPRRKPTP
jgi:hypothetical protein